MHGTTRSRPDPLRAFTGSGCGYAGGLTEVDVTDATSLGPRPFLYVDLCACAGKGEGQERKGGHGTDPNGMWLWVSNIH